MNGRRAASVAVVAVVALALAWVLLRGGSGTDYRLRFTNAGQLVKGDDVQVGGRRIGTIREISLTADNEAEVKIRVDDDFSPLHEGTTALIRATSLAGIANRYIALTPAPNSNRALDDDALLRTDKTTSIVDLDQLFDTFDKPTRTALQQFIQGNAAWYQGRGKEANEATKYLAPTLSSTRRLLAELVRDQGTFDSFLANTSRTMGTLAQRRATLTELVSNTNTTMASIGDEQESLSQALSVLPQTLRKANTTFVNLRATLDDLDVLVAESKPATKDLARFFAELRPLVRDARPTIGDLRRLVRSSGDGNDLTDLLRQAPALERAAKPAFSNSIVALRKSTPVLTFIRPYSVDLVGWLRDFGQGASNYDANGHFARIQPIFNSFTFTDSPSGGTLTPSSRDARLAAVRPNQYKRCPGTASQPPADGSAPYRDANGTLDCDPSQVIPGP